MKVALLVLAILVGLLSIAAGAAKIALIQQEVEFLSQFDFANPAIVIFGIVQVLGGSLMLMPITRFYGAITVAAGFAISVVLILIVGDLLFAGLSMVPVLLASLLVYTNRNSAPSANLKADA